MLKDLKLGTHMDNGLFYGTYQDKAAAANLSLYLYIFLSVFKH